MKILVKFPSRSRPEKFLKCIEGYIRLQATQDVTYLVSIDHNDQTMNNSEMLSKMTALGCHVRIGDSQSKIHAVNRDMSTAPEWDICALASDDMICQVSGWDAILQQEMMSNFPDTDGVLFHWDGDDATFRHNGGMISGLNTSGGLNTMCIMGRKYFNRFHYIYHPTYYSLWCDNEFTDVADILKKQLRSTVVLFKHDHYSNNGSKPDALMIKTQSYYKQDGENYRKRKMINFGL